MTRGPRPIVTASGALGPVPSVPLEAHLDCSGDGGSYTLGGLSEGFPTLIGTYAEVDCAADASAEGHVVMLGGVPPRVLPSELWGDYPLTADLFEFPCGPPVVITPEVPQSASDIPDPLNDPDYEFLPWWDEGYADDNGWAVAAVEPWPGREELPLEDRLGAVGTIEDAFTD